MTGCWSGVRIWTLTQLVPTQRQAALEKDGGTRAGPTIVFSDRRSVLGVAAPLVPLAMREAMRPTAWAGNEP